jgi:hypothetical protein
VPRQTSFLRDIPLYKHTAHLLAVTLSRLALKFFFFFLHCNLSQSFCGIGSSDFCFELLPLCPNGSPSVGASPIGKLVYDERWATVQHLREVLVVGCLSQRLQPVRKHQAQHQCTSICILQLRPAIPERKKIDLTWALAFFTERSVAAEPGPAVRLTERRPRQRTCAVHGRDVRPAAPRVYARRRVVSLGH